MLAWYLASMCRSCVCSLGPDLSMLGQVIRIAGYVFEEKLAIANQYLIPSTMEENGVGRNLDLR